MGRLAPALQFFQDVTMPNQNANSNDQSDLEKAAAELDWIAVHGYGEQPAQEGLKGRTMQKVKENPFIPIGCIATAGILGMGLVNMMRGNRRHSQLLMRLRVASQGLTVAALVVGAMFTTKKI